MSRNHALALPMTEKRLKCSLSLAIFITSASGSKSLASIFCRFSHLERPQSLSLALDTAENSLIWPHLVPKT